MSKKSAAALLAFLALAACSSSQPRIIQATASSPEILLKVGMATQIEMPDSGRVQSITVGNPALVTAEQNADVVNLLAKEGTGETNLIIRAHDEDGHTKVYQYHVTVQNN
jgi:Flp pilus assembly secretin CpaC